ncbi:MAG: phosphodiester glycosidase family protein [Clostridia bacterium]|nr:phosphodiester glycosidase family protein [Clostridia bacterium]
MRKVLATLLCLTLLTLAVLPAAAEQLAKGDKGEAVLQLKNRMYELGYFSSTKFTNEYTSTVVERVRQLQKMNGLKETGVVSEELWQLIFSDACVAADGSVKDPAARAALEEAAANSAALAVVQATRADVNAPFEIAGAPERDEKGFLLSDDEFVIQDDTNGLWVYLSNVLQVVIHRVQDKEQRLIWYEADVRTAEGERMKPLFSEGKRWIYPRAIARANKAVLTFSDDFHAYRRYNKMIIGTVIRNGEIISDKTKKPTQGGFPKLENMAYFADGSLKCYNAQEHTAQEYLEMGATDVLAFGPILVTDGHLGEHMKETEAEAKKENYYHYREPRMALGMVEPGHYIVLDVTGRTDYSKGVYLDWVAMKMLELGATEAINLDGGWTTSLCFMGESLNMKYSSSRKTTHIMSFGYSELVPD